MDDDVDDGRSVPVSVFALPDGTDTHWEAERANGRHNRGVCRFECGNVVVGHNVRYIDEFVCGDINEDFHGGRSGVSSGGGVGVVC